MFQRFKVYRAKHLRAESIDGSLKDKLRRLLSNPKGLFKDAVLAGGLLSMLAGAPTPALAQDASIVNNTTQESHTQTVDYNSMIGSDELAKQINEAVAASQAVTDARHEDTMDASMTSDSTQETSTPAINEEIDSRVPEVGEVTDDVQIQETTNDMENVSSDMTSENTNITNVENNIQEDVIDNTQNDQTTQSTIESDKNVLENTENGYQVFEQDGQIYVVGDVSEDQLQQITDKYGSVNAFDKETVDANLEAGSSVILGDSGYTATKDENGNVVY